MQKIALMVEPETEGGPPQRLSRDERSYLSVAYKNVVGMRRAAWRVLNAPEKLDVATEVAMQSQLQNYARVVESELNMLCDEVIELVSTVLIANATETEELVFYQKMAGDYFRYKAEFLRDDPRDAAVAGSKKWYSAALTQAGGLEGKSALASTDPIRLGLILNYSVFMYEIQGDHSAACDVAKKGFDDAVEDLESLEEEAYKDATLIMQLLRDNLSLWTTKDEE
jgi:14-3-3 protein epsilon